MNFPMPSAMKRTADLAKQESEHIIMRELTRKTPQRWSDLLKNTQISSRTLKKALNRLEEKGLLYRNVEQSQEYPPRVFYGLSPEGRKSSDPLLFATSARPYVLGVNLEWKVMHEEGREQPSVTIGVATEKKNMKDRITLIGKRLGVLHLFALLKALEDGNMDWLHEIEGFLNYDPFVASVLNFKDLKLHASTRIESVDGELLLPIPTLAEVPEQKEVKKLKNLLEQIYPEEVKTFEEILKNRRQAKLTAHTLADAKHRTEADAS